MVKFLKLAKRLGVDEIAAGRLTLATSDRRVEDVVEAAVGEGFSYRIDEAKFYKTPRAFSPNNAYLVAGVYQVVAVMAEHNSGTLKERKPEAYKD
ncbi:hypothetical protein HYV80_05025 [Candidatus Woesearchaeota archaeon]|nr:hypothetical protein [Candidatus Woesearchaeota archaeon]